MNPLSRPAPCRGAGLRRWLVLAAIVLSPTLASAQGQPPPSGPAPTPPEVSPAAPSDHEALLRRLAALEKAQEQRDLEDLRRAAEAEAAAPAPTPTESVFTSGARALQALNPEISVTADLGAHLRLRGSDLATLQDDSGMHFRMVGIHFEANLDPYAFAKVAVSFTPTGVGLGEAYGTWVRVLPGLSLTMGKFRQQFGVVNRWHVPALDQFEFPLALQTVFGPEGLNQVGLSLEWRMPALWASAQTLTVQVTNGMNPQLFSGQLVGIPVALLHLRNYWDLTPNLYLELGLSGMWGTNHRRDATTTPQLPVYDASGAPVIVYDSEGQAVGPLTVPGTPVAAPESWRDTFVGGADLTLSWAPARQERYQGFTWRSEYFVVGKETTKGRIQTMGVYSYVDARLSESWVVGVRGDLVQPFALENGGKWTWGVSPYVTWWQSAWVKLRLQGTHLDLPEGPSDTRLMLQAVLSVGPHKHERY